MWGYWPKSVRGDDSRNTSCVGKSIWLILYCLIYFILFHFILFDLIECCVICGKIVEQSINQSINHSPSLTFLFTILPDISSLRNLIVRKRICQGLFLYFLYYRFRSIFTLLCRAISIFIYVHLTQKSLLFPSNLFVLSSCFLIRVMSIFVLYVAYQSPSV